MESIFNPIAVESFRKKHNLQPFRIKQIYHEIFKNSILNFQEITTLSKELRDDLSANFSILPFSVENIQESENTIKFLLKQDDGSVLESVIMMHFHDYEDEDEEDDIFEDANVKKYLERREKNKTEYERIIDKKPNLQEETNRKLNRLTLCISSQVGCPVWCIFCVTGKLGFMKNLDDITIFTQILCANNYLKKKFGKKTDGTRHTIRNVVFMWMWEPFLNYENVKKSIEVMLDRQTFSLSKRHITISTSGVLPGIKKMLEDNLDVMLAVSLHAPNQELRKELIPTIGNTYPLDALMEQLDDFTTLTDKRIFYEYIMIKDKTDSKQLAEQLANLMRPRKKYAHINLIPYNENPTIDLEESSRNRIMEFKRTLESHGITATLRETMWRNVQGACGQLGYEKVFKHREEIKKTGKNIKRLGR